MPDCVMGARQRRTGGLDARLDGTACPPNCSGHKGARDRGRDPRQCGAMHPNPIYRTTPDPEVLAFASARGFGTLTINGTDGPLAAHVPFVLTDDGTVAECHLVRSNPIARALGAPGAAPLSALLAVAGPDGYISPDWYGVPDQVPTWNYVAAHLRGPLEMLPPEALRGHLDRLSAAFEARLAPKPAWKAAKMTPEVLDRMMRQIVPCRMRLSDVQGTWKLGQNKTAAARSGAADGLERSGVGQDQAQLAALIRAVAG